MLKCYRIWFTDESAILRDAENVEGATEQGATYLDNTDQGELRVKEVECLTVVGNN